MRGYRTIASESFAETVVKKSRFLAFAYPVQDAQQAIKALDALKKAHYAATHHCYAYIIGETANQIKYSDDNEPQGTAGQPILEVLLKKQLSYVLVAVVRYYGGVQLGANGLVRAYGAACTAAVDAAQICEMVVAQALLIQCEYAMFQKVERFVKSAGSIVQRSEFAQSVSIHVLCKKGDEDALVQEIQELCAGCATCTILEETLVNWPNPTANI